MAIKLCTVRGHGDHCSAVPNTQGLLGSCIWKLWARLEQAPAPDFTCLFFSECQWLRLQICLYLEEQVGGPVLSQLSALSAGVV